MIFGQAPADDLLSDVLDPVNSNHSDYKSNSHTLAINSRLVWGTRDLDGESSLGNILLSDLTLHCRRGYAESALNTDEYLWNASASWYWKKMRLTFALDGYDLLHQIKAISQYVDPLGRTASWSNTLPRYAMLRIRYHLDLSPR